MVKSIDEFTISDWLQAQREMSSASFKQLKKIAGKAGVPLPAVIRRANSAPRILFDFDTTNVAREVRVQDTVALNKFRHDINEWCDHLMADLRSRVQAMGLVSQSKHDYDKLIDSFETYIKYDNQYHVEPVRVGIRFARHGVFLHYGAGRGYGGRVGSRWLDRYGYMQETDPMSLGKMGTGNRHEQDWFNSVLDWHVSELADIAANYCADMLVDSSHFFLGY